MLSVGLLALAGCGGGGASGSPSSASVSVYVGDDFSSSYAQVWTTIYHVDASVDGTSWTPVFDSANGMQTNLSSLSSTAQYVGTMSLPPGAYTMARVTVGDHMRLVSSGGAMTDSPIAASNGAASAGKYTFDVAMPVIASSGATATMALDFNLANFRIQAGVVQMAVQQMDPARFNGMAHQGWLSGTVSGLNPGVGFTLNMGMMRSVSVQISSASLVTSQATGLAATLADGQRVDVQGTVDPVTEAIGATSVQVLDGGAMTYAGLQGSVASVDSIAGSFQVVPAWATGFAPAASAVTVQTNGSTAFTTGMMGSGSVTDVTVGKSVMVTGSYDTGSGVVTASRVRIF